VRLHYIDAQSQLRRLRFLALSPAIVLVVPGCSATPDRLLPSVSARSSNELRPQLRPPPAAPGPSRIERHRFVTPGLGEWCASCLRVPTPLVHTAFDDSLFHLARPSTVVTTVPGTSSSRSPHHSLEAAGQLAARLERE
jgi:hypothetical protein